MTGRRKGTPCACETDPCSCGSSKGKCVKAVNNVSPDPNGDLVIRGGTGIEVIQSGDDLVINNTANPNAFIAGNNIELNPSGDDISIDLVDEPVVDSLTVNGTSTFNGDIIQNGSAYETHAEKIYTRDDYIIMREGAITALAPGDYAGFQVKLYDGINDGRLGIDRDGVARVGDVGDEQPLLTRDEAADLTDGHLLEWDATDSKAVDSGTDVSAINTAINGKVSGTGNIGSDTKPIKIVDGVGIPVSANLMKSDYTASTTTVNNIMLSYIKMDKLLQIDILNANPSATGDFTASLPTGCTTKQGGSFIIFAGATVVGQAYWYANSSTITVRIFQTANYTDGHCLLMIN